MQYPERVYAKDLRPGDECAGSGQIITAVAPPHGGRVRVARLSRSGKRLPDGLWNSRTRIGIFRPPPCPSCGAAPPQGALADPESAYTICPECGCVS